MTIIKVTISGSTTSPAEQEKKVLKIFALLLRRYLRFCLEDICTFVEKIYLRFCLEDICTFVETSALHTSFSNCNWKPILQLLKVHKLTKEAVCLKYLKTNNGLVPFQKWPSQ